MSRERKANTQAKPDEMRQIMEPLTDVVRDLTSAIDDLTQELERNANLRQDRPTPLHLPLTELPKDPTTRNWRPKFGRDETFDAAQPRPPSGAASSADDPRTSEPERRFHDRLVYLSSEIARLEQIAALLVIAISQNHIEEPEASAWDAITDWAHEWFDRAMLLESLAEFRQPDDPEIDLPSRDAAMQVETSHPPRRQQGLFAEESAGDDSLNPPSS